MRLMILVMILGLITGGAQAAEPVSVKQGSTLVSLQIQERETVAQDVLQATLYYEAKDMDAASAQSALNKMMERAVARAKKVEEVKVSTGSYSAYQHHKEKIWVARQSLMVESKNKDVLLALVHGLQKDGLAMQGLSYFLSAEKQESLTDDLLVRAIKKSTARAEKIAVAMGKKRVQIIAINHGVTHDAPQPYMKREMMALATSDAAPQAEAGESDVVVSVDVEFMIQD